MPICNKTNLVLSIGESRNFLQRISDGQPIVTIMAKTVWATALGVYFGAVYVMSKNLWVPIILHFIINLCGIPFCFSTNNQYPTIALAACLVSYIILGIYGVYIVRK